MPVELAHIVPWSQVQEHTFGNLIALCPTCHTRYDQGDIDRKSMLQYKANLSVLNSRYGDLERRVLQLFANNPRADTIRMGSDVDLLMMYLVEDGLLEIVPRQSGVYIDGEPTHRLYKITRPGREFVVRWIEAQPLEPQVESD